MAWTIGGDNELAGFFLAPEDVGIDELQQRIDKYIRDAKHARDYERIKAGLPLPLDRDLGLVPPLNCCQKLAG